MIVRCRVRSCTILHYRTRSYTTVHDHARSRKSKFTLLLRRKWLYWIFVQYRPSYLRLHFGGFTSLVGRMTYTHGYLKGCYRVDKNSERQKMHAQRGGRERCANWQSGSATSVSPLGLFHPKSQTTSELRITMPFSGSFSECSADEALITDAACQSQRDAAADHEACGLESFSQERGESAVEGNSRMIAPRTHSHVGIGQYRTRGEC